METGDRIVVAHIFKDVIEANIVKAKLDAHGIPCFLSGENLTALTTHLLSGGILLHIFEEDRDEVSSILSTISGPDADEDDLIVCPSCGSKQILRSDDRLYTPVRVVRFFLQMSKKHFCLDCSTEFDS